MVRFIWKLIAIAALILVSSKMNHLSASHVAGGHIEYENVGSDSFLIKIFFYRDCSGIPVDSIVNLKIRPVSNPNQVYTIPITVSLNSEVSQVCASLQSQTTCNGGSVQGMEFYTGSAIVDLWQYPPKHTKWNISYTINQRNPSENGNGGAFHIEAILDNDAFPDNNSPSYGGVHIPYLYGAGQYLNYDISMLDPDGDSLVYSLDTAMTSFNQTMSYQLGFSGMNPMPPLTLDSFTGKVTINGVPNLTGNIDQYVIVYRVDEYEHGSGIYKGTVIRDFQIVVISGNNTTPNVASNGLFNMSGVNQISPFHISAIAGVPFCFDITFSDSNQLDSLLVSSNLATYTSGLSVSTQGSNPITATFCGTFDSLSSQFASLSFLIGAKDNHCPYIGQTSQTVMVDLYNLFQFDDKTICQGDSVLLNIAGSSVNWSALNGPAISPGVNFGCAVCNSTYAKPSVSTVYSVQRNIPGYGLFTDTFTITVLPPTNPSIQGALLFCQGDTGIFTAQGIGSQLQYNWNGSGMNIFSPSQQSTPIKFNNPGTNTISVTVSNGSCVQTTQQNVEVLPAPSLSLSNDKLICSMQSVQLKAHGPWIIAYHWSPSTGLNSVQIPDPFASPVQTTTYVVTALDSNGCTAKDSVTVVVQPTYINGIASDTSGNNITQGTAYMVKYFTGQGLVVALDSAQIASNGAFQFVASHEDVFFKVVPDSASYPYHIPTYYQLKHTVQNADYYSAIPCSTSTVIVNTLRGINPGGQGFIGGFVAQGAGRTEPVQGLSVILRNSADELIAHQSTNGQGYFSFKNLASGTYYVDVDSWGIDNDLAPIVLLSDGEERDSLQFILHEKYLELLQPLSVDAISEDESIQIYPNPTAGDLTISSANRINHVILYNALGEMVLKHSSQSSQLNLPLHDLDAGLYMIEVVSETGSHLERIILAD